MGWRPQEAGDDGGGVVGGVRRGGSRWTYCWKGGRRPSVLLHNRETVSVYVLFSDSGMEPRASHM